MPCEDFIQASCKSYTVGPHWPYVLRGVRPGKSSGFNYLKYLWNSGTVNALLTGEDENKVFRLKGRYHNQEINNMRTLAAIFQTYVSQGLDLTIRDLWETLEDVRAILQNGRAGDVVTIEEFVILNETVWQCYA
jgi:hypothetical protein